MARMIVVEEGRIIVVEGGQLSYRNFVGLQGCRQLANCGGYLAGFRTTLGAGAGADTRTCTHTCDLVVGGRGCGVSVTQ
jgi:hypothetical protein